MNLLKGSINSENLHNICKICLAEELENIEISTILKFEDVDVPPASVESILHKVVASSENSETKLSLTIICHDCLIELKSAYLLILKYEEAHKVVESFLETYIKPENTLDDIVIDNEEIESDSDTPHYATRNSIRHKITKKKRCKKKVNVKKDVIEDTKTLLHPCPICTKEFTALDLRDHAHTHKALKKYLRIPTDKKVSATTKFSTKRHLLDPKQTLFMCESRLHKCPYCNEDFPVQDFRVHVDVHRKQSEFKCDKCARVFKKLNHLNTHRVKHLKEFPYKCEQCGKGFVIKRNYDCHILTHTNDELPLECRFCLKRFSNPEHLNRHQIIHTENVTYSVKYRVCKCHHCLKTFKDKGELKQHICMPIEQTVNTRYPCKICKKVFKHSSGLYNHNRNIHKLKGAKTLCSVCGNYVSNIYNHMMRHTGEKPYQCNQCEKRFIAKPQLRQHLLVHSGLKPYVCSVCAKAFNNLYNLQVHERIHKGDRCHICVICNKGFLEKSYLKKHMNVHAKIENSKLPSV